MVLLESSFTFLVSTCRPFTISVSLATASSAGRPLLTVPVLRLFALVWGWQARVGGGVHCV